MEDKVMMAFCAVCGERFAIGKIGEVGAHTCPTLREDQILNSTPAIPQSSLAG